MTLDELYRDYTQYAIISPDGKKRLILKHFFPLLWEKGDGILFDEGSWGGRAFLLKPDELNNCLQKLDWDEPEGEGWEIVGKFEKQ